MEWVPPTLRASFCGYNTNPLLPPTNHLQIRSYSTLFYFALNFNWMCRMALTYKSLYHSCWGTWWLNSGWSLSPNKASTTILSGTLSLQWVGVRLRFIVLCSFILVKSSPKICSFTTRKEAEHITYVIWIWSICVKLTHVV
jgi:hypothetical protein